MVSSFSFLHLLVLCIMRIYVRGRDTSCLVANAGVNTVRVFMYRARGIPKQPYLSLIEPNRPTASTAVSVRARRRTSIHFSLRICATSPAFHVLCPSITMLTNTHPPRYPKWRSKSKESPNPSVHPTQPVSNPPKQTSRGTRNYPRTPSPRSTAPTSSPPPAPHLPSPPPTSLTVMIGADCWRGRRYWRMGVGG